MALSTGFLLYLQILLLRDPTFCDTILPFLELPDFWSQYELTQLCALPTFENVWQQYLGNTTLPQNFSSLSNDMLTGLCGFEKFSGVMQPTYRTRINRVEVSGYTIVYREPHDITEVCPTYILSTGKDPSPIVTSVSWYIVIAGIVGIAFGIGVVYCVFCTLVRCGRAIDANFHRLHRTEVLDDGLTVNATVNTEQELDSPSVGILVDVDSDDDMLPPLGSNDLSDSDESLLQP